MADSAMHGSSDFQDNHLMDGAFVSGDSIKILQGKKGRTKAWWRTTLLRDTPVNPSIGAIRG